MLKVRDDYFKGPASMFAPVDLDALLEEMDAQGVQKAILMDNIAKPHVTARGSRRPGRTVSHWRWAGSTCSRRFPPCVSSPPSSPTCRWCMPLSDRASGVTPGTRQ